MTQVPDLIDLQTVTDSALHYDRRHIDIAGFSYPDGKRIAVNFTLDFDAMLLRRLWNEPPQQLSKGEFGGRVGIWRLIEMFTANDVLTTVFTPGRICQLYPEALRFAVANGHELADHMWEHDVPREREREADHISKSVAALTEIAGKKIIGTRSSHTPELLRANGIRYNSFTSARQLPFWQLDSDLANPLLQLPFHYALDDAMFFSFGWLGTPNEAQRIVDSDEVFDIWLQAFRQQYEVGGYVNFLLHPFVSGHAQRVDMLERLIRHMQQLPDVWFPTCAQVAEHCFDAHPLNGRTGSEH
ncbi:polysaccharide deacetylase family protein [Mesorhizobium sp. SB112]|uniref:polysaccharide deacetylase family protein n=1 Tax=Mesorhizobium sp. SB112 TaxID=3151853 RepID=UPI0032659101